MPNIKHTQYISSLSETILYVNNGIVDVEGKEEVAVNKISEVTTVLGSIYFTLIYLFH